MKAPIEDFTGWKAASTVGKFGKGLGAAGAVLSVGANVDKYFSDGVQEHDWADFGVDTGVDLAAAAGAAGVGAAVGSFFVPPAGTVVGAIVGFAAGFALNFPWVRDTSATDAAKRVMKKAYR